MAPLRRIERVDREHVDFHPGLDQRAHVPLEEGRSWGGILTREYGEAHARLPFRGYQDSTWSRIHVSSDSSMNTRWYRPARLIEPPRGAYDASRKGASQLRSEEHTPELQ